MRHIEYNAYSDIEIGANGSVSGYMVKWNVVDGKKDTHMRGAYTKTIEENKGSFIFLPNHDQNDPIGRVVNVVEDDIGVRFEANFASTETAQKYRSLLQEGVIAKFSMGWVPLRWEHNEHGGRRILEVKLFEISPVAIPVGANTEVLEVNNAQVNSVENVLNRFYDLSKNIGDKMKRPQNEAEILKLAKLYEENATQPPEGTEPVEVSEVEVEANTFNQELFNALIKKT